MDTQSQMQAIVDRMVGGHPSLPLVAFDPPWLTVYSRVTRASDYTAAEIMLHSAVVGLPDSRTLYLQLHDLLPPDGVFTPFPSLSEMAPALPPVDWLWPGWIPRGMLTLLGASPGAGKSLVALDLARRIIAGDPFPDGAAVPNPGSNVLIVDAEGSPTLLNQRAQAWGIDSRRLYLMLAPRSSGLIDLSSPPQQALLCDMVRDLQPSFVVVDSLSAATAHGETSLESARALLGFLGAVAGRAGLAMLIIHHLRKRAGSGLSASALPAAADDLRGSSHLSAAARSVLVLSLAGHAPGDDDPTDLNGPRRLQVVKTNLCRYPSALGLLFEGGDAGAPTLRYTGPLHTQSQPSQLDKCARWLLDYLAAAGEPVRPGDVVDAACDAGFGRDTLYRTRRALAGHIVDLGGSAHDPTNRWTLAQLNQESR